MPVPFTKPANLIGRFAVVKPWPDVQAAEDENIARLQITARSLGLECIVIDPEGVRLDAPDQRISDADVDFVIHLHFETPKAYDAFSFVALWNPLRFFKDWGYRLYSRNLLTHDDFLSCSSTWADHHVRRMTAEDSSRLAPCFTMYHSLSEPIFEPSVGHGKIFYAGINWDKLGKKKGRHQDLLLMLDKAGVLRIHGPRIFNNVNVWEGYKCYVGPVPFDGVSMIKAISEAGIALVFSSDAHKESELMSNRLFESLAAGAVIICDDNPFARRFFGDTLLYVDATDSLQNVCQQIIAHHSWIRTHPNQALALAREAQAIFKEKFTLDRSLASIYTQLNDRKGQLAARLAPADSQPVQALLVLPDYSPESLENLLASVNSQSHRAIQSMLLVDASDYSRHGAAINQRLSQFPRSIEAKPVQYYQRRANGSIRRRLPLGQVLSPIIETLPKETIFTVLTPSERWFTHHINSLARALQGNAAGDFAYTTSILRHVHKGRIVYDLLDEVNLERNQQIPPGFGRFLFKRSSLREDQFDLMDFLDMRALSPLLVRAKGVATGRATTVARLHEPFASGELLDDALEQCIVEDRFNELAPPAGLGHIQTSLAYTGLTTSLQTAQPASFQSVLLRIQNAESSDATASTVLRKLRQLLIYELFHHEKTLSAVEQAAARLPRATIAEVITEVMATEKCDPLLAYWVGLHMEATHRPLEALRAFNRSLLNTPETFPTHYTARTALKAASLALTQNKASLAEKVLREVVLKLQPSNSRARSLLDKISGSNGSSASVANDAGKTSSPKTISASRLAPVTPAAETPGAPLVSAIVSTYNSEKFLRGCLEDLLSQTIASQLEIIVVDSASAQNERAIVEEFQKRHQNIVYIRTDERETVYGAWNRGIKAARGKYITNANTDDRHRRDALEILAGALDNNPDVSLVYANCRITQIENETFDSSQATRQFQWLEFNAKDLLLKGCFCGPQPMWRREVHDEHGYFDPTFVSAGDYEFWLKIARTRKFLHVNETLGLYLESPASVEHRNAARAAQEVHEARRRHGPQIVPGFRLDTQPAASANNGRAKSIALPEAARIGQLTAAREALKRRQFPFAWKSALEAIEKRPYHPEAFLLLAEIAQGARDGSSARQYAQQAAAMAPAWDAPRKFLRGNLSAQCKHAWMTSPHAAAQPRLSVCLIVKNEEQFLARCLASIRDVASQIVVVDTGSADRTIEIAKEHGAEVHHFPWNDDFAAARNAALAHATGDWVLSLDADEELLPGHKDTLRGEMQDAAAIAFRLPIIDQGREQEGRSFVPRLFRNAPGLFFLGRVHEQVFSSVQVRAQQWGLKHELGQSTLLHHGYTADVVSSRNKVERNLRLLELALKELPNEPNLLMSYGAELTRAGQADAGLAQYAEAVRCLAAMPASEVAPEMRETLLTQYTARLLAAKKFQEVVALWQSPVTQGFPATASQHFSLGLAYMELKQPALAVEQMRQCLAKRDLPTLSPVNAEILKGGPSHCLALCLASLDQRDDAARAFQAAISANPQARPARFDYARFLGEVGKPIDALKILNELVSENSGDLAAWELGGALALSKPEFREFACNWTGEAVKNAGHQPVILTQRAEALLLSERLADALSFWRDNRLPQTPRILAARILCETLPGDCQTEVSSEAEAAISQEMLKWYRRLIAVGAKNTLEQLHQRLERLRVLLPSFVTTLEKAHSKAAATAAAQA